MSLRDIRDISAAELEAMARDAFAAAAERHLSLGHVITGTCEATGTLLQMARIHGTDVRWPVKPGSVPK